MEKKYRTLEITGVVCSALATIVLAFLGWSTLKASTRAWVGPVKATVAINPESRAVVTVHYRNPGKEPALNFGDTWDDDWVGNIASENQSVDPNFERDCVSDSNQGLCKKRIGEWQQKCESKPVFEERVAFPDFQYERTKTGPWIDQRDHKKLVFLLGCFVYRSPITLIATHRTSFCYYYRIGQEGDKMRACPVGNSAN